MVGLFGGKVRGVSLNFFLSLLLCGLGRAHAMQDNVLGVKQIQNGSEQNFSQEQLQTLQENVFRKIREVSSYDWDFFLNKLFSREAREFSRQVRRNKNPDCGFSILLAIKSALEVLDEREKYRHSIWDDPYVNNPLESNEGDFDFFKDVTSINKQVESLKKDEKQAQTLPNEEKKEEAQLEAELDELLWGTPK